MTMPISFCHQRLWEFEGISRREEAERRTLHVLAENHFWKAQRENVAAGLIDRSELVFLGAQKWRIRIKTEK
jgi:hypothetical protein